MTLPLDIRSTEADAHRAYCFLTQAIVNAYFLDRHGVDRLKQMLAEAGLTADQLRNACELIDLAQDEEENDRAAIAARKAKV